MVLQSSCQALELMNHLMSCVNDPRSAHMGPTTLAAVGRPARLSARPVAARRPKVGRMPYTLLNAHGMRIDPAMSVPHPIGEPFNASKAPSPPHAPPADKFLLKGLTVEPTMLLVVSPISMDMGTFVFAMSTAPASLRRRTSIPSSAAVLGLPIQLTYPHELSKPLTWNLSFKETGRP